MNTRVTDTQARLGIEFGGDFRLNFWCLHFLVSNGKLAVGDTFNKGNKVLLSYVEQRLCKLFYTVSKILLQTNATHSDYHIINMTEFPQIVFRCRFSRAEKFRRRARTQPHW